MARIIPRTGSSSSTELIVMVDGKPSTIHDPGNLDGDSNEVVRTWCT